MGAASVILGVVGMLCAVLGALLFSVPVAGMLVALAAILCSLASVVLGGVALSRANEDGESNALPVLGIVFGVLSLVLSLCLGLTCGSCNACITAAPRRASTYDPTQRAPQLGTPAPPERDAGREPDDYPAPPPAFPPPPMNDIE